MSKVAKWIFPVAGGKDGVIGTAKAVVGFLTGNAGLVMDGVRQVAGAGRKGDAQARQASILNLQLGEVPRQAVIGIACTAGSLGDVFSFGGQYGTDKVTRCVNLADHAIDGIQGFYINEVYYPWVGDGLQAAFSNKLSFHFRNASADGYDPPQHVQQNGGWTTSDRMVGITHIWIDWFVDDKVWPQGHPEIRFVLRGLRVYDPRFDPQFGYSGPNPQTWADRSSHRFSRNAKVLRYAYTRGIFVEGRHGDLDHLLIGRGLSEEEAPPELVIADANLCDEIVDGVARYTANGVISAAQPFIEVDGMFAAAMAGVIVQREGTVDVEAGQAKAVVATFTDADLVGGEKVGFSRFLGDSEGGRLNTFIGRYIEPLLGFKDHSAPVRRSLTDIVTDGGPRETTISLALVTEVKQVDRILEINRLLSRLERRGNVVLPPRFAGLEEGDWVAWQSARRHKGATVRYRIEAYREPETWRKYLTLREIASSVFGVPDPIEDTTVPPPPPVVVDALAMTGVIAEAITLPGETSVLPAVRFSWDTPTDAAVLAIRAEVRRVGETDAAPTRIDDVVKGQANVTNGVGPDQALECRLVPIGDPSRPVLASNWITVSTSTIVAGDVSPTAPTIVAMQDAIDLAEAGVGSLNTAVASLNATVYTAGTGLKARSDAMFADINTATTGLKAQTASLLASLNTPTTGVLARLTATESQVATNNSAAVNRLNALEATVNTTGTGLSARLATAESAIVTNRDAAAQRLNALEATVNTAGTGLSAKVSGLQSAVTNLESGKANASDLTALTSRVTSAEGVNTAQNARLNTVETDVAGKASSQSVTVLESIAILNGVSAFPTVISPKTWTSSTSIGAPLARADLAAATIANGAYKPAAGTTGPAGPKQLVKWEQGRIYEVSATVVGGDVEANARFFITRRAGDYTAGSTAYSPATLVAGGQTVTITRRIGFGVAVAGGTLIDQGGAQWIGFGVQGNINAALNGGVAGSQQAFLNFTIRDVTDGVGVTDINAKIGSVSGTVADALAGKADATRVSALEATVNTSGTGLSARVAGLQSSVSDLQSGKASASDLANLSAEVTTARGGTASLNTRLNTVESTVAGKASASSVTALEATVSAPGTGLLARTGAAENAIVSLQTGKADASRVTQVEASAAAALNGSALNKNSTFALWPAGQTLPSNIVAFGSGLTVTKVAGRVSPNAPQLEVASGVSNAGIEFTSPEANWNGPLPTANGQTSYWAIDYKIEVGTPDLGNSALRFMLTNRATGATVSDVIVRRLYELHTSTGDDQIVEGSFLVACSPTVAAPAYSARLAFFARTDPIASYGRYIPHRVAVRPALPSEIASGVTLPAVTARVGVLETATTNLQTQKADASRVTSLEATVNTPGTGVSARLTTVESVAASADGRAKAIKGVVLDVNGYVSGYSSTNDGTSAAFEVSADKFGIRAPGSGERTEYRAGNWYVYSPSENTRTRYGKAFGGDQKLVWWTGPTSVAEGSETKGNAYVYMSQNTVGGSRFGGSDVIGPGGTLTATANTGFIGGGRSGAGYVNTSNQVTVTVSGGTSGATIRWTRISGDSRIQMNNAAAFTTGAYATIGAGEVISAYFMGSITKGGQSAVVYVQVDLSDNGT